MSWAEGPVFALEFGPGHWPGVALLFYNKKRRKNKK
jgi:hypothetical protein